MNKRADIHHDMEGAEPELKLDTLKGDIRDAMLSRIRQMKTGWPLLVEAEQAEIVNGIEMAAGHIIRSVVRELTAHQWPYAVVTLGEVKIKGEKGIEAKIGCSNIEHNRSVLGEHVGQMVQIVMVDSDQFMGQRDDPEIQPDQSDMFSGQNEDDGPDDDGPRMLPRPEDLD